MVNVEVRISFEAEDVVVAADALSYLSPRHRRQSRDELIEKIVAVTACDRKPTPEPTRGTSEASRY